MNVVILATSPRKGSNTLRFANYLKNMLATKNQQSTVIDFHPFDIPNVGRGSLQKDTLTPFQTELISAWEQANVVIIATPEYNWTVNGDVLTALHQLRNKDFMHLFDNKTFAFAGVSAGRGGKVPCLELTTVVNKIINFTNQYSIVSPRICEVHEVAKNIDENAQSLGNAIFEKTVQDFVDYTFVVANRWYKPTA